jgi:hypothetical protein
MAITTLDGVIAGMQPPRFITKALSGTLVAGRPFSFWASAGSPGAGSFDTTLNGVTLTAPQAGQIPWSDPVSGNAYLARLSAAMSAQPGLLLLCDRLWHNGGFNITLNTAQNITSPTWPARSLDGTTNGDGVLLGVEVSAGTGAGTPTLTASYTNQAGTASRSATNSVATVASSAAGSFYPLGLQAGDTGVRSVQSLTLSATWTSGTINMVAYRVLAALEMPATGVANAIDAVTGGFPRLYNGSVPFLLFVPSTTTTTGVAGSLNFAHG